MNSISLSEVKNAVVDWMESSLEGRVRIPNFVPSSFEAEQRIRNSAKKFLEEERF